MKETIELAKELGFDCNTLYPVNISILTTVKNAVLQDWVRDTFNIHVVIYPMIPNMWTFGTYRTDKSLLYGQGTGYVGKEYTAKTPNDALELGLQTVMKKQLEEHGTSKS